MSICGLISASILLDCDYPPVGGADDRLIVINHDDWDNATITLDVGNPQLITNIVLPTGKDAYQFAGKNHSVEPTQTLVKQRYAEVYDHEVMFKVFKGDATTKQQLDKLAKGNFVCIIQNNLKGAAGNSSFEVYGIDVGLETQELERVIGDTETQGAYNVILRTPEEVKEGHLPATLYDTSFAATKAIVDALLI